MQSIDEIMVEHKAWLAEMNDAAKDGKGTDQELASSLILINTTAILELTEIIARGMQASEVSFKAEDEEEARQLALILAETDC